MRGRVASPLFVGRREELSILAAALARARDGEGSLTLIGGEAGIGKSRLNRTAAAAAAHELGVTRA